MISLQNEHLQCLFDLAVSFLFFLLLALQSGQVVMYGCTADRSKEDPHSEQTALTLGALLPFNKASITSPPEAHPFGYHHQRAALKPQYQVHIHAFQ